MPITALFLDIGSVRLSKGWGHHARKLAAKTFDLDLDQMEDRHHLTFDTYEVGKLTLEQHLSRMVFYQKRPFTSGQFRKFTFAQSHYTSPRATLASVGLQNDEGLIHEAS